MIMNELSKISVFRNYYDHVPASEVSIQDFCINVIRGDYKNEVEAIRDINDKATRDKIKATLPAVTISGTFSRRKNEALIQHSGFICLDFDSKGNEGINDWPAFRNSLSDIENVYFAALSVSGKGLFLIIPISTPTKHKLHFLALEKDFLSIGLVIDEAPKNPASLRGMSYDPEAVINERAETYRRVFIPPAIKKYKAPATNDQLIINARKWMEKNYCFTLGRRHNFIKQFTGVLHRFGVDQGSAYRELISYASDSFQQVEIESIIKNMYSKELS